MTKMCVDLSVGTRMEVSTGGCEAKYTRRMTLVNALISEDGI